MSKLKQSGSVGSTVGFRKRRRSNNFGISTCSPGSGNSNTLGKKNIFPSTVTSQLSRSENFENFVGVI